MNLPNLSFLFIILLLPQVGLAVDLYENFPTEVNPQERYVFYLHGLIVEGDDPKPIHDKYGLYDFSAIKQVLFKDGGFNLIAHHRRKNTAINEYVETLVDSVNSLIDGGVPPSRITLIGFSRGGHLVAFASSRLESTGINTALLASCISGDITADPPVVLGGNFLSIYEASDRAKSCEGLAKRSELSSFEETAITTGKEHGAFFTPLDDWVTPLKDWIQRTNR